MKPHYENRTERPSEKNPRFWGNTLYVLFLVFIAWLAWLAIIARQKVLNPDIEIPIGVEVAETPPAIKPVDERIWDCVFRAICWVETKNDPTRVGTVGELGILQIRPHSDNPAEMGLLNEANRILKQRKFTDKDLLSVEKSRKIWEVVNAHRNPGKSFIKAIKIHNPRGGSKYIKAVYNQYLVELMLEFNLSYRDLGDPAGFTAWNAVCERLEDLGYKDPDQKDPFTGLTPMQSADRLHAIPSGNY